MTRRAPIAIALTVGLLFGPATLAFAQSALPLRGAVDTEEPPPPPPEGQLATTSLEVKALDPPLPAPRRRSVIADPYAPQGIGTGGLRLYPSITVGGVYTSNVKTSKTPEADQGLQLKPSLRVESDWVRHSWTAGASGTLVLYNHNSDLNAHNLNVFQRLRLDVRRGTDLQIDGSYTLDQAGIGDSGVPLTATGYRTEHALSGAAALTHDFGPVSGRLKAGVTGRVFDDVKLNGGGVEDNSDRNYVEPSLAIRATFTDAPILKPYVEATYAPRIHSQTLDRNGLRRDSRGFGLAAGVEVDSGPIWSGDLGLTYLHRSYDDPALADVNSLGLLGNLTWSPAELTRIVLSAGTSISETSSATVSGNPTWTMGISGTHALRDNVALSAGASVDIEDTGTTFDKTYDANLDLTWKLNPQLSWTAGYDFTWLDSETPGRGYKEHRISTGLTLSR